MQNVAGPSELAMVEWMIGEHRMTMLLMPDSSALWAINSRACRAYVRPGKA